MQNPARGGDDTDSLGSLYQLGDSLGLRNELYQLIQSFFSLCGKSTENSFLVIPIDDTDLQLGNAYRILEETRKYLSLPNVVVVMAADLDQLRLLVIQHYYEELKGAAEQKMVADEYVRRMATKYLDKLIPSAHAIFLPRIRDRFERNMELRLSIGETLDTDEERDLQNETFDLIQEKTGLIFAKHRHFMHSLIPETLRGAQHLYRLLDRMDSPEKLPKLWELQTEKSRVTAKEDTLLDEKTWTEYCKTRIRRAEMLLSNLDTFQSYFINDWCSSKLRRDDWETVKQIADAVTDHAVKYAALLLRKKVNERRDALSAVTEKERRKDYWRGMYERPGISEDREPENYIDLLRSLDELEKNSYTLREHALGFAVHTLFTIRFNKMALEIQREQLNQELEKLQKDKRSLFCFDYQRIQNLLNPCLFDTREIQNRLDEKDSPVQLYIPIPMSTT